ncbi:hypothetical protein KM043_015200 [Ampulex compressa]|nr:hypothetical protein KM043_015200 [Ampulex compressa]
MRELRGIHLPKRLSECDKHWVEKRYELPGGFLTRNIYAVGRSCRDLSSRVQVPWGRNSPELVGHLRGIVETLMKVVILIYYD